MAKKLETPCPVPKRGIPWELRYDYARGGWNSLQRRYLYVIREIYGASAVLEVFELVCTMDDRVNKLTNAIRTIFNLTGKDCETIGEVFDIWDEFTGIESTILERSQTINRRKVTNCPWKTEPIDISDWSLPFFSIVGKSINQTATLERPKGMCAGDPYCEYIWKIEKGARHIGDEDIMHTKLETPCAAPKRGLPWELKYNFLMNTYPDFLKGILYANRKKFGGATAVDIYERVCKLGDRTANSVRTILKVFKIEGNDAETWGQWMDVWNELGGWKATIIERSKTIDRRKITKCSFVTEHMDVSEWDVRFCTIAAKTINEKAIFEMPKTMCEGDPYCEFIFRIEK